MRAAALARRLTLTKKQIPEFREALATLVATKRVREGKKGRLRPRHVPGLIAGIVKRVSTGAGFFLSCSSRAPSRVGARPRHEATDRFPNGLGPGRKIGLHSPPVVQSLSLGRGEASLNRGVVLKDISS